MTPSANITGAKSNTDEPGINPQSQIRNLKSAIRNPQSAIK
jgi:hypothetical protein